MYFNIKWQSSTMQICNYFCTNLIVSINCVSLSTIFLVFFFLKNSRMTWSLIFPVDWKLLLFIHFGVPCLNIKRRNVSLLLTQFHPWPSYFCTDHKLTKAVYPKTG